MTIRDQIAKALRNAVNKQGWGDLDYSALSEARFLYLINVEDSVKPLMNGVNEPPGHIRNAATDSIRFEGNEML